MKEKQQFTITYPCHFSIEINAHSLTYLVLCAIEGHISFEALSIDLFNSQPCENAFRSARSMSGVSSSIVNFTVFDFLRRADKISAIQAIRTEHEAGLPGESLRFPKHHKHGKFANGSTRHSTICSLQYTAVQRIVDNTFRAAYDLIQPMIDHRVLRAKDYETIDGLSGFIRTRFQASKVNQRLSQETYESQLNESNSDQDDDNDTSEDGDEESDGDGGDQGEDEGNDNDVEEQEHVESLEHIVLDSSEISFKGMPI